MKTGKRALSIILVITILILTVPIAYASVIDSGYCGEDWDNILWSLDDRGTLTLNGEGKMEDFFYYTPWDDYSDSIKRVVIDDQITSIGDNAFGGCEHLQTVSFPSSLKTIGENAFNGTAISSVNIPNGVKDILRGSFSSCENLSSVILPESVRTIGDNAFSYTKIVHFSLPNGIKTIGNSAFSDCPDLLDIQVPATVESIGSAICEGCNKLERINVDSDNSNYYTDSYGVLFDSKENALIQYPLGRSESGYVVPFGVSVISYLAFNNAEYLEEIEMPRSLTTIEGLAFSLCYSLKKVIFSEGLQTIGDYSFVGCHSLIDLEFPETLLSVGDHAFDGGCGISTVFIPKNVKHLGEGCFKYSDYGDVSGGMHQFLVDEENEYFSSDNYGCLYNKDKTKLLYYPIGNARTYFSVPDSVVEIGDYAFCNSNDYLGRIVLPDGLKRIGKSAFAGWAGYPRQVRTLEIPSTVEEIGENAFAGFPFDHVTIPSSVKTIRKSTFSGCFQLESVDISDGVLTIDEYAFFNCFFEEITIPRSVSTIDWFAFGACYGLKRINLGSGIQRISGKAFDECSEITDVYYDGTQGQWNSISIDTGNEYLTNATIHYNTSGGEQPGEVPVESVILNYTELHLQPGVCDNLIATISPVNASNPKVSWRSSNPTVATVDQNGMISAEAFGSTTITATTVDGGFTATCLITVGDDFGEDRDVQKTILFKESADKEKTKKVSVEFKRSWFQPQSLDYKLNTQYNHQLATFCSDFAMMGYDNKSGVESYLNQCGFQPLFVNMNAGRDEVNVFIAVKTITIDATTKKNIVFVGTIGSHLKQWYSNFDPFGKEQETGNNRFSDTHVGFADARDYVYNILKNYMAGSSYGFTKDNTILLLTGHSRGAATANLLAARIIKENKWVNRNSIYTYTFATPNVTTDWTSDTKYDCIFNIVNPEDFVTKVMLKSWDFSRYGKTYTLPSKTNTKGSDYSRFLSKMRSPYYSDFTNGKYYSPYLLGEWKTYNAIESMGSHVTWVDELYSKKYYYHSYTWTSSFSFFKDTLIKLLGEKETSQKAIAVANMIAVLKDPLTPSGISSVFYRDLLLYFADLDASFNLDAESLFKKFNTEGIDFLVAHHMQTYCAFMHGLSASELTADRKGYKGSVNCPVGIEIIDKETNEVVGRIVDNVVDEEILAKDNSVVMTVEGDEKSFWLPSDGDYEVKLTGNDAGSMDYTLAEIDSDAGELSRTNFFTVALEDGLVYTSEVQSKDFSLPNYTLTREDGAVIMSDETFDETNAVEYTVTLNADEHGVVEGDGFYTSGDYAIVSAFPYDGYVFDGWYSDGTLVSSEATYRFRVDKDVTLMAEFKQHEHVYESAVTTEPTCDEPGEMTYSCVDGDNTYTEPIPALGHIDEDNDGYCDREGCGDMMTGGDHCPKCGKIHTGFFDKIVGFFHKIIYRLTHLFG